MRLKFWFLLMDLLIPVGKTLGAKKLVNSKVKIISKVRNGDC